MISEKKPQVELVERLHSLFPDNSHPVTAVRAPGRVNLIGEHTDYNAGYVLPAAIDREVSMAAQARDDDLCCIHSVNFGDVASFSLRSIAFNRESTWLNYPQGVAAMLLQAGYPVQGMNAVVYGTVPIGAGLSSSAAIEVASALAFSYTGGFTVPEDDLIRLCQKAENVFVGMSCGIMDQSISVLGKKGHALLIDCRTLDRQLVRLPADDVRIVVCDTRVERRLVASEYNLRRQQCEEGVRLLSSCLPEIEALRDVRLDQFAEHCGVLPEAIASRCQHVIEENGRVLQAVQAMAAGDLEALGELFAASHRSLRDLYEVSCPELNLMVELATSVPGVVASRMTGGGFGGCTVNLVKTEAIEDLRRVIEEAYPRATGITPAVYVCEAADGAGEYAASEG